MKSVQQNWKQALVIGLMVGGSVLAGCQGNGDYKSIKEEPPSGDATTMDSSRQMPINESGTSRDNTSDKPATTDQSATAAARPSEAAGPAVKTEMPKKGKGRASIDLNYMKGESMSASKSSAKVVRDADGVYSRAEVMPMFPGGQDALQKFVEDNIEYPEDALQQNEEADVRVAFTVDEKGKVTNAKVISDNGAEYGLKEEAIAVVNKMPAWTPGKVNGKKVKTRMQLPISFQIEQ